MPRLYRAYRYALFLLDRFKYLVLGAVLVQLRCRVRRFRESMTRREQFEAEIRRSVAELTSPPPVTADSRQIDESSVQRSLYLANLWLTVKVVEDFNAGDWNDLAPHEREELERAVSRFLSVARDVPPAGPATPEQVHSARSELLRIHEIISTAGDPRTTGDG